MKKTSPILFLLYFATIPYIGAAHCSCNIQLSASSVLVVHYETWFDDCIEEDIRYFRDGNHAKGYIFTNTESGTTIMVADADPTACF
jgi:hypothetical protein